MAVMVAALYIAVPGAVLSISLSHSLSLCTLFGACTLCVLCHVCAASSSFVFLLVQALFAASGVAAAACRGKVSHLPFRMAAASASDATGDDIKLCPVCNLWVFSWDPSFDCCPCGRPVHQKCKEAHVKQVRCHECSACSGFCAGFGFGATGTGAAAAATRTAAAVPRRQSLRAPPAHRVDPNPPVARLSG